MRNQTQNQVQAKIPRVLASQLLDVLVRLREAQWVYVVVECGQKEETFYLSSSESLHYDTYGLCSFFVYLKECLVAYGEVLVKFRYALPQYRWVVFFEHYIVEEENDEVI